MKKWFRSILLLGPALLACQPEDSILFFSEIPYPSDPVRTERRIRLDLVREFGERNEGLVFGRITSVAVKGSSKLAVFDADGCEIWLVDLPTNTWRTIGGCGDGPGEFRYVSAMAFSGDTLLAFDDDRASIVKLSLDGTEIDRFRPPLGELGAGSISDLSIGSDGSILAGLNLRNAGVSQIHEQLVSFDQFGGKVTLRGLVAPLIAQRTPRPIVRSGTACTGESKDLGEVVLAVNHWGPQLAVLRRGDLAPERSVRVPVVWARAGEHSLREGHWGPIIPLPKVVCGDGFALVGYREQEGRPSVVMAAAMAVFDLKGDLMALIESDAPPESGSILYMTPGAAAGNRVFLFTNSFFDYPIVREYQVIEEGRNQ